MELINPESLIDENLEQELKDYQEYIENLTLDDLVTRLEVALMSTEVILEGFNIVNNINENQGISLAGIIRLREAVIETLDWIDCNLREAQTVSEDPNEEL